MGTGMKLTGTDVRRVIGNVDEVKVAAVIATGATLKDLEEAAAWAAGESDVLGKLRRHASPVVAAVYDILTTEEKFSEDRD